MMENHQKNVPGKWYGGLRPGVQETYMGHVCYSAQSSFSDTQWADQPDQRFTSSYPALQVHTAGTKVP